MTLSDPRPSPTVPAVSSSPALARRSLLRAAALGAAAAPLLGAPGLLGPARARTAPAFVRSGRPLLTHGVQAGDVREGAATLWTRADRPARLLAEVSRDPSFRRGVRTVRGPVVTPDTDLTGEVGLRGLPPGTELHYRLRAVDLDDDRRSSAPLTGRLRTAPRAGQDVTFLWSGDVAGQGWGVNPDLGGFRIADAMLARDADFFLCSGDTVYADGPVSERVVLPDGSTWRNLVTAEKSKVAETLDEFRGQYRYNLLADNWRAFLAATPQVGSWDDHEVTNNWYPGELLEDARYTEKRVDVLAARARRAFHDYVPVAPVSPDPEGRLHRVLHHGPHLDLFVLDMRTHKDPNTGNREPLADGGVLGEAQTAWLLRELERSTATWKVIAADLPIGLVVPDGASAQEGIAQGDGGAPLGRELDLARVLSGLKRLGIRNHVWLTADVHYTAAHHYSPDRATYQDFDPFWEFVSGPLNAGAFGPNALDATFGPRGEFVAAAPRPNTSPAEGSQFFGEVQVEGRTGRLTVTLRDVEGAALFTRTLDPAPR
ncbi:alkaline phosphatase D family protein [Nocardioides perillae]|uniref:Alkaline phosphatase D n=1 Tax=Nocardioides perillae TaxID=1119534 RepID=A0A7Y9UV61_9ACTN|nr:alkaline phosphatase D family protein [Nocardioides perillae]NYG55515.1 alkaline phosphatase D [Nocardioides perillae]